MVTETAFLHDLKKLGLNDYEARGYLALMERTSLTATQIAALSRIPRTKVYDVTESLIKKGLCSLLPGKINKYRGLEISAAADSLLRENERAFSEKREQIQEAAENLKKQLSPIYGHAREDVGPLEYIEIIKDSYQIHKKFMRLMGEAKEEILGFTKPPYSVSKEGLQEQAEQQVRLVKKGLRIRSILEVPKHEMMMEWLKAYIAEAAKYGDQVRVAEWLPIKMAIFDSRIVIFTLEDPVSKQISVTTQVVEHRALAETLKITFETFWKQAKGYDDLSG